MGYKAVIFDVGDTLLEYYPSQLQIYIDRLAKTGITISEHMICDITNAISKATNEQILKEQNGAPRMSDEDFNAMLDKAVLRFVCHFENESVYIKQLSQIPLPQQELRIIPGTIQVLQSLKNRKLRLGIVSNHRSWLPDYLKNIGLADFFETIVVSEIVGVEKPDIRIMHIALNNLSLNASDCLYVGDHPFDVFCAKKANLACAWLAAPDKVLPDSILYKEDYRLSKLQDLLNFI